MNFQDRVTTRKGSLGERIAERFLRKKGYTVYTPDELDGAHPIDRIGISKQTMKVLLIDVKSKPQRTHFPDTGIDFRHWQSYWTLSKLHNAPVFLIFVDEDAGSVYGQYLDVLERRIQITHDGRKIWYPKQENRGDHEIRYYAVASMITFGNLTDEEQQELQSLSTRAQKYRPNGGSHQGRLPL